ncbi:hypothetical protein [Arthrobacter sp. BE255]|uniref:hypothetical protein n=1 Tax=Arthrobacter sp. BE255 TaxID=2817721 RepID=UPI002856AEB2|nr:hypothetical protein [Arthrobacter sp. BE255]MDR7159694.1 hypothetical protein [Arthrobacter sp. BE255]
MNAIVHTEQKASFRLSELGLDVAGITRTLQRADAEAATVTKLAPPNFAGIIFYGRTVQFLREEYLSEGWNYSNPKNQCRTISPSGEWQLIASSGAVGTGVEGGNPSTRNPKGITMDEVVAKNAIQTSFDLGPEFALEQAPVEEGLLTWILLYQVVDDGILSEISLPRSMSGSFINDWQERIILPRVDRSSDAARWTTPIDEPTADLDTYDVPVSRIS